jgi:NADPH:quinone reductase-like Zn-dependent oxidoreductase
MKAMRFHEYGAPNVLRYEDIDPPIPGPGEVRIAVAATSFNRFDAALRVGFFREMLDLTLPHVPGIDVSGTIDALGADVSDLQVGDAVIGILQPLTDGSAAEYVVAPADLLAAAPTTLALADAAALPVAALTAWQALFEHAELGAAQRLLVNGAGGAVGGHAVQLAKRAGAHVIATASPRSVERVGAAGADEIIDHTAASVADAVVDPVDVVLNVTPAAAPEELVPIAALIRPGGIVVSTTTPVSADDERGVRAAQVYVRRDVGQLAEIVALVDAGELRVDIADRRPLADLGAIHAEAEDDGLPGKVVVVVAGEAQ